MSDLTPITREEALLDGADLEPITRKEQFIKRIYDKTQEIPEPITREEWFLKKAGEGGGGVTVEQLNATENGTYSEEGKAYSPVIVEVPEPTLVTKSITANGTYTASDDNADGYSSVTVAVEGFKKKSISNTPTDIASFNDGTANPMPSLEISIEPQQDLHGYDYPWVGGAGKNKLNPINAESVTVNGITFTVNEDGTITANGTAVANAACYIFGNADTYVDIGLPAGNYVLNGGVSSDCRVYVIRDRNGETTTFNSALNNVAVDIEEGDIFRVYVRVNADVTVNNAVFKPMLRLASETDSTFAPYSNICPISGHTEADVTVTDDLTTPTETHTTSIPFHDNSDNPITVYGGMLNVTSGELTVTMASVDAGTLSWTYDSNVPRFYTTSIINSIKTGTNYSAVISDRYATYDGIGNPPDNHISQNVTAGVGGTSTGVVIIKDTAYTDKDAFTAALSGSQLVYELATPQTYQLTPTQVSTLLGQNNIFADCGQILEGKYFVTL